MKRIHLFGLMLMGIMGSLFAQPGHHIELTVAGMEDQDVILAHYFGDQQMAVDTVLAKSGKAVFSGPGDLPKGIYLMYFPETQAYFECIIDADQHFSLTTDIEDFYANMKVEGSIDNKVFFDQNIYLTSMTEQMQALQEKGRQASPEDQEAIKQEMQELSGQVQKQRDDFAATYPDLLYVKVIKAMQNPQIPEELRDPSRVEEARAYFQDHYFDELDLGDVRMLRTPALHRRVMDYLEKFTPKDPKSVLNSIDYVLTRAKGDSTVYQYLTSTLLNYYAESPIMGYDEIYARMVMKYYAGGQTWWTDREVREEMVGQALRILPNVIGAQAYNFAANDPEGNKPALYDGQGEYIVLYFWKYSCSHCKKTTPVLAKAMKGYSPEQASLYTVNTEGDVETWKEKLVEYGLSEVLGAENTEDVATKTGAGGKYNVISTPRIFILDAQRKIVAKQLTVAQMQQILDRNLGIDRPEEEKIVEEAPEE